MPSVSQRLIQSPEAPGKPFGILGYRLGKIAALGGYGAAVSHCTQKLRNKFFQRISFQLFA